VKTICEWHIGLGLTWDCNMSCPFCYSYRSRKRDVLPLSTWKRFFSAGFKQIQSVNYGTRENTLSQDWFELIDWLRDSAPEIRQSLTTNGWLARSFLNNTNQQIVRRAIDEVDVSLDFCDSSRHDSMRGRLDAYAMVQETVAFCRDAHIPVTLVMIGLDRTFDEENLEGMFRLADEWGAFVRINIYRPVRDLELQPLSPERLFEMLRWILQRQELVSISDSLVAALCHLKPSVPSDPSAHRSLRILPSGDVTPSTFLISGEWVVGNIETDGLLDHLQETDAFQSLRTAPLPQACCNCRYSDVCRGGTLDRRLLYYRTSLERDPYCPYRFADSFSPLPTPSFTSGNVPVVHANYLPTMIFKARRKQDANEPHV
jgi:radical SAM protein with 4Fe4S-binding SPASM domain